MTPSPESLLQFDLTWTPGLIEPGLQWPIESQQREPALARDGLDPVLLEANRRLGTEPQMSATQRYQKSLTAPSTLGSTSTTRGPFLASSQMKL